MIQIYTKIFYNIASKSMKTFFRISGYFCLLLVCVFLQITEAQAQPLSPPLPCSLDDSDTDNDGLTDICDIEGLELIRDNPDGRYELRRSLDFNDPSSYRDPGAEFIFEWSPIYILRGEFNGDGHTISNLPIHLSEDDEDDGVYVGMFSEVGSGAIIRGLGLLNINIMVEDLSRVGGLVGSNGGEIIDSYVINSDGFRIEADQYVGGLIGENAGSIVNSYTTTEVHGNAYVGGLVGFNYAGASIRNSSATGIVVVGESETGGLVGQNEGSIIGSYANGSVKEISGDGINSVFLGGLVGWNGSAATIRNSYAIGTIEGARRVGGLIGENRGEIINSYAKNEVSGSGIRVGGLVGLNSVGTIRNSYASGDVISTAINYVVGGLVGEITTGTILNTYATGDVTGGAEGEQTGAAATAGGLVGRISNGIIENSYAVGIVTDGEGRRLGSLVGLNSQGVIRRSYARNERGLVGLDQSGGSKTEDSFSTTIRVLQSATEPGTIASEVYYQWLENDWSFGHQNQYPILKYTAGSGSNLACGSALEFPDCGTFLPGQAMPRQLVNLRTQIRVFLEGALREK